MTNEHIRRCIFRPFRQHMGPTFTLDLFDTGRPHRDGPQWQLGYRLHMSEHGRSVVLFEGEDYGCSPLHSIDGDESVEGLMSFLTLRPGDTDADYFDNYTPAQLDYADQHAEALSSDVYYRFGDDDDR